MPAIPTAPSSLPASYRRALEDLAAACREAHALADLLEYAAGVLRGRALDPEGPSLDAVPGSARLLALLPRRSRNLDAAERAWEGLAASPREGQTWVGHRGL
jgi:hypothetical protein